MATNERIDLEMADRHIETAERLIKEQEIRVADGHSIDPALAESVLLLSEMRKSLVLMRHHRELILAAIAQDHQVLPDAVD